MLHVVLVEPEIPPNTGNVGRLCLATGSRLHLVEPLGFSLEEKQLRRAGLDYWPHVDLRVWPNLSAVQAQAEPGARLFYLTTKTRVPYWSQTFRHGDYLVFGRETKGLPESLLHANTDSLLTIPMQAETTRSLNLATSVGIVLYEAIRQLHA